MLLRRTFFFTIVSCYSARLFPSDVKILPDLQEQKASLKGNLQNNSFLLKQNFTSKSLNKPSKIYNTTSLLPRPSTKWQVERVTKRQYHGIVNMLWRKTKIFINIENTTPIQQQQDNITKKPFEYVHKIPAFFTTQSPIVHSYRTSYIEFYYADEHDNHAKQIEFMNAMPKVKVKNINKGALDATPKVKVKNINKTALDSFLVFHIKGPLLSKTIGNKTLSKVTGLLNSSESKTKSIISTISTLPYSTYSNSTISTNENVMNITSSITLNRTRNVSDFTVSKIKTESTTVYDKIKFFEMYDKHTRLPITKKANMQKNNDEYDINNYHKILLEHVDQSSHGHNKSRHSKKHIESNKNVKQYFTITEGKTLKTPMLNIPLEKQNKTNSYVTNKNFEKSKPKEYQNLYSYINKSVSWSEYPFAAVYVYESLQVHCDAASISAHWLVASGSCLSRMKQSPVFGEGRSAFVAYCGDRWWEPERVSYVKYSVVHPWYHPKDRTRRNLYNIGVIQVVTSMMSACNEWGPVSLMSHHFAANQGGSEAIALGWGLDRYDTRYAAIDFPRVSLTIYKELLFSDSCPGSISYGKVRRFDDVEGVRNVYCLSLPPYSGEERDPIHGSLLLVGGKLIALYLQEERRPFGEQSAQYTGIWRLIPWVLETAKEPEEMETFTV